jgi:long-chain acyl-CoA synthetase
MELQSQGKSVGGLLAVQHAVADKLVLSKIRERFGGRVRFFISGSAALNPEIARWFGSVGLLIIEGYGLTETSAATCVNRPSLGSYNYGTVGWPVPTPT